MTTSLCCVRIRWTADEAIWMIETMLIMSRGLMWAYSLNRDSVSWSAHLSSRRTILRLSPRHWMKSRAEAFADSMSNPETRTMRRVGRRTFSLEAAGSYRDLPLRPSRCRMAATSPAYESLYLLAMEAEIRTDHLHMSSRCCW